MHHLWTSRVGQSRGLCRQFTAIWTNFMTQNHSQEHDRPVQLPEVLWQFHVHREANQQFMVNRSHWNGRAWLWLADWRRFCSFLDNGFFVGPHGHKMKIGSFVVITIFEKKITVCTCLLSSEGYDSLLKHLDLALLLPNKTNEGVKVCSCLFGHFDPSTSSVHYFSMRYILRSSLMAKS